MHRGILTQALPRPAGNLGSGEFEQNVDGMTGNPEANRREHRSEQRDRRHRVERPRFHWRFPERQRAGSRNEHISDGIVMAAGAPQSDTAPSVKNFAVRRGKKEQAHERRAVRHQTRLIAIQDPAAADDPAGVLTAASKRPPARDPIAPFDDHGISEGPKRPRRSDQRIAAINFTRGVCRQISAKRPILAADCQAPARSPIGSRDLFYNANEGHRIGFFAAQTTGNPQAK